MTERTVYYGGFDPGSGRASLYIVPEDGVELETDLATIDSLIARGDPQQLLNRGNVDATIADVIRQDEILVEWNGSAYYLDALIKEGRNKTDALADHDRYWSDHVRVLLLALAGSLIPENNVELRLVTALPVSLYNKENRQRMKESLSNYYRFTYNGHEREMVVQVGYVAMEGQGILIHCGEQEGEQVVLDIGERTTDCVAANGQKLITSLCAGKEDMGVGVITDAVKALAKRNGRQLSTEKAHDILYAWSHNQSLPKIRAGNDMVPDDEIAETIDRAARNLANEIRSWAASKWDVEGEEVGERFDQILIAGGGAYYVGELLQEKLPRVSIPADAEDGNVRGYSDLALTLEDRISGVWEID